MAKVHKMLEVKSLKKAILNYNHDIYLTISEFLSHLFIIILENYMLVKKKNPRKLYKKKKLKNKEKL
jgi:hypothetical protein